METLNDSEFETLTHVLLKRPEAAFLDQENLEQSWQEYNYPACPDFNDACAEYAAFAALLIESGVHLHFVDAEPYTGLDSLYIRDALLITWEGVVVLHMGKPQRNAEPQAAARALDQIGIPILGEIKAPGCVEGGDVVWFDRNTLAVGLGYRTNEQGIQQLADLLRPLHQNIVTVPLPHWRGPGDVLHLMSLISPLDHNLALVYSPLLPVIFRKWLLGRGIELLEVPEEEYATMGCNVLALAPRECIVLAGNPCTRRLLEASGVRVREYQGKNISWLGSGGPTCLTRPLSRSA